MAGLKRLGLAYRARAALDIEAFLPAVGQGAIALDRPPRRRADAEALAAISDAATATALAAERAFLAELDGSCRTPIAGHARFEDGALTLRGQVLREDGSESFEPASPARRPTPPGSAPTRAATCAAGCRRACFRSAAPRLGQNVAPRDRRPARSPPTARRRQIAFSGHFLRWRNQQVASPAARACANWVRRRSDRRPEVRLYSPGAPGYGRWRGDRRRLTGRVR